MLKIIQDIPLGKNIRKIRKSTKMTQADLAAKLQIMDSTIDRSALAKIECGIRNIKASDLKRLKEIFNASFDEFFEE